MNKISHKYVIFFLLLTSIIYSQEVSRELNHERYLEWELMSKNKVKSVKIYNEVEEDNSFKLTVLKEYDRTGKGLGYYYFDKDSNIIAFNTYKYNNDTLVEEKDYFKNIRPEIDRTTKYIYNKGNQLIERENIGKINPSKITYIYDSNNVLFKNIYSLLPRCGRITFYIYDENKILLKEEIRDTSNNLIEEYVYRDNGRIRTRKNFSNEDDSLVFISNEMGDEIEYLSYSNGTIEMREITSRNKNGYWINNIEYDDGKIVEYQHREFDKFENVILEEKYDDGILQYREITSYDNNGLLKKRENKSIKSKNNRISYYKYNSNGLLRSIKTYYPFDDSTKYTKFIYEYYE